MSAVAPFFLSLNARLSKVYRTTTARPAGRICAATRLQYNRQTSQPRQYTANALLSAAPYAQESLNVEPPHKLLLWLLPKQLELLSKMTRSTTSAANPSTMHSIQANREKQRTAVKQLTRRRRQKERPHHQHLHCSELPTANPTVRRESTRPRQHSLALHLSNHIIAEANLRTQSVNAVATLRDQH